MHQTRFAKSSRGCHAPLADQLPERLEERRLELHPSVVSNQVLRRVNPAGILLGPFLEPRDFSLDRVRLRLDLERLCSDIRQEFLQRAPAQPRSVPQTQLRLAELGAGASGEQSGQLLWNGDLVLQEQRADAKDLGVAL